MSRERTFRTNHIWHDSAGGECECEINVTYVWRAGYAGDRIDPPEDATVEIISIMPIDAEYEVPERSLDPGMIEELCFDDWRDEETAAEERRAEMRADDQMMGRF